MLECPSPNKASCWEPVCSHLDRHISTLTCTFVSLHGCSWQLRALVLWKRGFLQFHLAFLSSCRHSARETLRWPALTWPPREHGCTCRHRSVTQPWRWDKGSRRAKAVLSRGTIMATQVELAGIVYGAGTVQTRRNRVVGTIGMKSARSQSERHTQLCWVRLATVLLLEPFCSLRSHSHSSTREQPA